MRDILKMNEYFDVFIIEQSARVEKFEKKINTGEIKEDRITSLKEVLLQIKLEIIIAKYSRGDSLDGLKNEFTTITDSILELWDKDSYEQNLRMASLVYLFGIDEVTKKKISDKLKERPYYDSIIESILFGNVENKLAASISFPNLYSKLSDAILTKNVNILVEYLRSWYKNNDDSPWYDTHKCSDFNIYYGYWCFEAAAIAKRLNLKDDSLQNEPYYPYDMVHFVK